jgi:hypothetical protein
MEVEGKIKVIGETNTFGANGFRKREVVITVEEQYPQQIMIEFVQDKTDLLNSVNIGEAVRVSVNLRGREWVNPQGETKYFNSIQGWKILKLGEGTEAQATPSVTQEAFEPAASQDSAADNDDLPF